MRTAMLSITAADSILHRTTAIALILASSLLIILTKEFTTGEIIRALWFAIHTIICTFWQFCILAAARPMLWMTWEVLGRGGGRTNQKREFCFQYDHVHRIYIFYFIPRRIYIMQFLLFPWANPGYFNGAGEGEGGAGILGLQNRIYFMAEYFISRRIRIIQFILFPWGSRIFQGGGGGWLVSWGCRNNGACLKNVANW